MGLAAALPAGLGTPWQLAREAARRARRLGAEPLKRPSKGGASQETGQSNRLAHGNQSVDAIFLRPRFVQAKQFAAPRVLR